MNQNLYVITPIFNPFGYESRIRLYRNFKRHMDDSGAKLFTIEAAFGDRPFEVTSPDDLMNAQLRTSQVLWHKERLINLAFRRLLHVVPDLRYVAWFDADVTFANPDWLGEATHALAHLDVIQPFGEAINLSPSEQYMWNCPSSFRSFIEERGYHQSPPLPVSYTYRGHPGLAWAARREFMEKVGLLDTIVSGSGDLVMANALKGDYTAFLPVSPSAGLTRSMQNWTERAQAVVRGRIGFTRGSLLHHWHGKSEERGYEKRWSILSFHQFDPATDIRTEPSGMAGWAGNKPQLEDDIRLSLGSRKEDER